MTISRLIQQLILDLFMILIKQEKINFKQSIALMLLGTFNWDNKESIINEQVIIFLMF